MSEEFPDLHGINIDEFYTREEFLESIDYFRPSGLVDEIYRTRIEERFIFFISIINWYLRI